MVSRSPRHGSRQVAYRWYNVDVHLGSELNEILWIMKTFWGQVLKFSKSGFILFGNSWRDSLLNSDYLGVLREAISPPPLLRAVEQSVK